MPKFPTKFRMILITGATDGIGLETAKELARRGHPLVLHGRNEQRIAAARAAVLEVAPSAEVETACADLSELRAVAGMARELRDRLPRLDVVVNNAGVYMRQRKLSADGAEMTMAVNHLSHFLLTLLLLPMLKRSGDPRVVTVSSIAHMSGHIDFDNLNSEHSFDAYQTYANSKLANALFTFELARREPRVAANCLHPGVIDTKLLHAGFDMAGASVAEGARTSVYLASAPEVTGVTGKYFDHCTAVSPSPLALDHQTASKLWEWSENIARRYYSS